MTNILVKMARIPTFDMGAVTLPSSTNCCSVSYSASILSRAGRSVAPSTLMEHARNKSWAAAGDIFRLPSIATRVRLCRRLSVRVVSCVMAESSMSLFPMSSTVRFDEIDDDMVLLFSFPTTVFRCFKICSSIAINTDFSPREVQKLLRTFSSRNLSDEGQSLKYRAKRSALASPRMQSVSNRNVRSVSGASSSRPTMASTASLVYARGSLSSRKSTAN